MHSACAVHFFDAAYFPPEAADASQVFRTGRRHDACGTPQQKRTASALRAAPQGKFPGMQIPGNPAFQIPAAQRRTKKHRYTDILNPAKGCERVVDRKRADPSRGGGGNCAGIPADRKWKNCLPRADGAGSGRRGTVRCCRRAGPARLYRRPLPPGRMRRRPGHRVRRV